MKKRLLFLLLIISLFIGCMLPAMAPSAADSMPKFTKKITCLTIGKSIQFQIKNMKKNNRALYFSSNKNIASIGKNNGKCRGKKTGKVTIYAKIYNKKGRRITTLKQSVKVMKSSVLPNASFHLIQPINPFDYTIKLGCSRILLKKEVRKSRIELIKDNGSDSSLSASFTGLSSNGKELTYTLSSQSQKKLSPKNGTMDGTYILSSPLFPKKLSVSYHERIGNYSLSGYVLSVDGAPVNQAYVKCMDGNKKKTCYTDKDGYYRIKEVKNPVSLDVSKPGFFSQTLSALKTSAKTTTCENFILHSKNNSHFSAWFHVTGQDGSAIPNASVILLDSNKINDNQTNSDVENYDKSNSHYFNLSESYTALTVAKNNILFSAETNSGGNLFIHTDTISESAACTKWNIHTQPTLSYENNFDNKLSQNNAAGSSAAMTLPPLSFDREYTLLIGKKSDNNSAGCAFRSFTFCPKDYVSQQFYFDVKLSGSTPVSLNNIFLRCNGLPAPSALQVSIYQRGYTHPIINTELTDDSFSIADQILTFSDNIVYSLSDDIYYIKVYFKDKEKNCVNVFPLTRLSISNGKCSKTELSPLSPLYSRILAYGDFNRTGAAASFERYQKIDGQLFYIDTLTTTPFQGSTWNTKTAHLILPAMEPDQPYILIPHHNDVAAKKYLIFSAEKNYLFTEKESLLSSPAAAKIECFPLKDHFMPDTPPELSDQNLLLNIASHFTAAQSFVRNCSSYPNSITVLYKKEKTTYFKTILPGTISSSPFNPSNVQKPDSDKNASIIDLFTNGKKLITTQKQYSS